MKKLNNAKWFTLGVVLTLVISTFAVPALAANMIRNAELHYRDIKVTMNGEPLVPKDVTGKDVEPFIMEGSTYLPLRAVAEALGLNVEWDATTETAVLTTPSVSDPNPTDDPAQTQGVFYTRTGGKYHYINPCGNGTYYECTLQEALSRGLSPCEKCVG